MLIYLYYNEKDSKLEMSDCVRGLKADSNPDAVWNGVGNVALSDDGRYHAHDTKGTTIVSFPAKGTTLAKQRPE